jgi:sporulation integral membrane protein YtvI
MPIKKILKHSKNFVDKFKSAVKNFSDNEKNLAEISDVPLPVEKEQKITVEISLWSATKVILVILGFLLLKSVLTQIFDTLLLFFFSLFLAAAFNPAVDKLENKFKIPRSFGVIILYILVFGILSVIFSGIVPILIEQISEMSVALKNYLNDFLGGQTAGGEFFQKFWPSFSDEFTKLDSGKIVESIEKYAQTVVENLGNFASNAFGAIFSVVNGIFNFALVLLLAFFMVVERDSLNKFFTSLFPKKYEKYILSKSSKVQSKIGNWVHGQFSLFFIIGAIAFLGLKILGVKYALTLAAVAGLAEFIPYLGPVIAFATAAPVAFNQSFSLGILVIIFYSFLQILEGNVIMPLVMKKAVGLSPIVTIIAMLVGWQFFGIVGVIVSVPIASILAIFISDFTGRENR